MVKRADKAIIAELRAEILRKQRNAGKKVSRNRAKGINFSMSGHDPRTNAKIVARYTASQLIAYGKRLDAFNSRGTQFVAGAKGAPISRAKFNEYKRLEAQHNLKGDRRTQARANIKVPGSGLTVGEREALGMGLKRAQGDAANKPFFKVEYSASSIVDIDKMISMMKNKLNRNYLPKVIKARRDEVKAMMVQIRTHEIEKKIDALSDEQFDVMVHETDFMRSASTLYELEKMKAADSRQEMIAHQYSDALNELKEYVTWAKNIPGRPAHE